MIIEVNNVEQFKELIKDIPINRFRLYVTDDNEILVRPSKTSKSLDTILWLNPTENAVDEWIKLGGKFFKIKKFYWREDTSPELQYKKEGF